MYQKQGRIEQQHEGHSSKLVSIQHGAAAVIVAAIGVRGVVYGSQRPLVRQHRRHPLREPMF